MTTICLNMIVKNESARIERCLKSVVGQIDTWAILDTGSTDNTRELIRDFFHGYDINGVLAEGNFINFSQARNQALDLARIPRILADYLLLVDADMELVGDIPKGDLSAPAFQMIQRGSGLTYWNTRLVRSDLGARYISPTHEYLDTCGAQPEKIHEAWFRDYADGANRPGKVQRDIDLLKADLAANPDNPRSWFYLAQSLREIGKTQEAIQAYEKRVSLGGWEEEKWFAAKMAAQLYREFSPYLFTHQLIAAYNERPWRAEPLHELARYYREKNMNQASLLFSMRGHDMWKPKQDLLFIEDFPYEWGFKQEISISGFYSKNPDERELGHTYCEELALAREAPDAIRDEAWNNLFFYTKSLGEQAPSFQPTRIELTLPDGFHAMNPSICRLGNRMFMNVRTVNYLIGPDGRYQIPSGGINTRNFLFQVRNDMTCEGWGEISLPIDFPCVWPEVLGFEDVRLFPQGDDLWCSATARQHNQQGWCEMVTARIGPAGQLSDWHVMRGGTGRPEKNWMPIISHPTDARFIYSCQPATIVDHSGQTLTWTDPPIDLRYCSGSTQAIPFDGGYLAMIHERQAKLDPMHGQRNYQQRFVWLDNIVRIRKVSRRFILGSGQGEFPCGMCAHPDGERLVITYGILDREAWITTVRIDEIRALLREVGTPDPEERDHPPPSIVRSDNFQENLAERALGYNRALLTDEEISSAASHIEENGWPLHPDRTKNWDVYLALQATLRHAADRSSAILDAGADRVSTYLPTLAKLGYERLHGINLLERDHEFMGRIVYSRDNIECTRFPSAYINFIACLSTIEHGVDVEKFLEEAARLLVPGGHLFISTDYWGKHIDTRIEGWRIFIPPDIAEFVGIAWRFGLKPTTDVDLNVKNQVCHHAGLSYTFMNLLFRKEIPP